MFLKKCRKEDTLNVPHMPVQTLNILILGRNTDYCAHKCHHTKSDFSSDVQDVDVRTTKLWVLLV